MHRPFRPAVVPAAVVVSVALMAGCTAGPSPSPSPSSSAPASPTSSASPTPTTPAAPRLEPDGSATDNLPFFRVIVEQVAATADAASGRAYIDALVAGGFDKAAMQVTNDTTTLGDPAESIQFSVRWRDGQCLVGQVGPATGAPVAVVLPVLGDGMCLLGDTRPIDW